jgi:predicted nucleic acid-binding protein
MSVVFLLDTCVLRELRKRRPNAAVVSFIDETKLFYIPGGALVELQADMARADAIDPDRAAARREWYLRIIRSRIPVKHTTVMMMEVWATLDVDPRLQSLKLHVKHDKLSRAGHDIHIAATALVSQLPIATMEVEAFAIINEYFPLPSIYDPIERRWHSRPEQLAGDLHVQQSAACQTEC